MKSYFYPSFIEYDTHMKLCGYLGKTPGNSYTTIQNHLNQLWENMEITPVSDHIIFHKEGVPWMYIIEDEFFCDGFKVWNTVGEGYTGILFFLLQHVSDYLKTNIVEVSWVLSTQIKFVKDILDEHNRTKPTDNYGRIHILDNTRQHL